MRLLVLSDEWITYYNELICNDEQQYFLTGPYSNSKSKKTE